MPRARILLADDNLAILEHVRKLLDGSKRYEVVATENDGANILTLYTQFRPDVIVLDISMGVLSGVNIAQNLKDSGCHSKIVFLTVHEDTDYLNAAMGAGGSGYVVKSRLSTDLVSAIEAVLSDKVFISASLLYHQP
jgi:DNA-binding NarL/FixJ family response regulator